MSSPSATTTSTARPTAAFVGASWAALLAGCLAYLIGLYNASMELNEKGYYLTLLLFGLFAAVSVQKSVRDRSEQIPVSSLYLGIAWLAVLASLVLLSVGLWNAGLARSEKGFYAMSFALSLFSAIAVQKNVRDLESSAPAARPLSQAPAVPAPVPVPIPAPAAMNVTPGAWVEPTR